MLKNYLIITFKVLQRRKFFTFVSLFGISFTLMLLIIVAAFLDHSFTPAGPEKNFGKVLTANSYRMRSPNKDSNWNSNSGFYMLDHYLRPLKEQSGGGIEEFSIYKDHGEVSTYKDGIKISFHSRKVDGSYFKIIDLSFIDGQPFTEQDVKEGNFVAIITESLQQKYFNGEPAVGKSITFDNQTFRVIGVVQNVSEIHETAFAEIWTPLSTDKNSNYAAIPKENSDLMGGYNSAYLVKSEEDMPWVKKNVRLALEKVDFPDPKEYNYMETAARTTFEHAATGIFGEWEERYSKEYDHKFRWTIIIAMSIFMLLPSLNLINLNLSRMMERAAEVGVRRAFGASIGSLITQFIVENIIITFIGAVIGIIGALFILHWLNGSGIFEYANFAINYRVLIAGLLITIVFGLFSGVYPAWKMAKLHPVYALKGGSK